MFKKKIICRLHHFYPLTVIVIGCNDVMVSSFNGDHAFLPLHHYSQKGKNDINRRKKVFKTLFHKRVFGMNVSHFL